VTSRRARRAVFDVLGLALTAAAALAFVFAARAGAAEIVAGSPWYLVHACAGPDPSQVVELRSRAVKPPPPGGVGFEAVALLHSTGGSSLLEGHLEPQLCKEVVLVERRYPAGNPSAFVERVVSGPIVFEPEFTGDGVVGLVDLSEVYQRFGVQPWGIGSFACTASRFGRSGVVSTIPPVPFSCPPATP